MIEQAKPRKSAVYAQGVRRPRPPVGVIERPLGTPPSLEPDPRPWAKGGRMAVDQLVTWAIAGQRAGRAAAGLHEIEARAAGLPWQGSSADGCAAVDWIERLGVRVDGGGAGANAPSSPVADAVVTAIDRLPDDQARLVREWAEAGTAPGGWRVPERFFAPALVGEDGAAEWLELRSFVPDYECEDAGLAALAAAAPVAKVWPVARVASMEGVAAARLRYVSWWDTLDALAFDLSCLALGFAVGPPSCAREPWAA